MWQVTKEQATEDIGQKSEPLDVTTGWKQRGNSVQTARVLRGESDGWLPALSRRRKRVLTTDT
jgi:hypothetical protein